MECLLCGYEKAHKHGKTTNCWLGISLSPDSGLILAARVGKHTDKFIEELVINTEGKTDCKHWNTDG